jgi:hypothetical protein
LVIVKQNPFLAKFFSEHFIFGLQIINSILLFAVDPTGEDEEEQLPRLQYKTHRSPDAFLTKKNSIKHRRFAVNRKEWAEMDIQPSCANYTETTIYTSAEYFHLTGNAFRACPMPLADLSGASYYCYWDSVSKKGP